MGDFNQWDIKEALQDFADVKEVNVGPTRGSRSIDRIFLNMTRAVVESGTLDPLETDEEGTSDHRVAYCRLDLPRLTTFRWETYTYRFYNEDSRQLFKNWMVLYPWDEVTQAVGSNSKAEAYQATLNAAMDEFFPTKTTRRKSSDLPWMSKGLLEKIATRKRLFWAEGGKRTEAWRDMKRITDGLVKERKKGYVLTQKEHILAKDANRNFFRHVKTFSRLEKPPLFDIRQLYEDRNMSDKDIAEDMADYFVKVSREFDPLEPSQVPITKDTALPTLQKFEVASRIKRFRKPKSMVPGDIFPCLVTELADFFAIPLTSIYNEISRPAGKRSM